MNNEELRQGILRKEEEKTKVIKQINYTIDPTRVLLMCKFWLGSESYGTIFQNWLIDMKSWARIKQTEDRGDFETEKQKNAELKLSIVTHGKAFNFLNCRITTAVEHYLLCGFEYDVCGAEAEYFSIPSDELVNILTKFPNECKIKNGIANIRVKKSCDFGDDSTLWSALCRFKVTWDDLDNL
jgi:hypothetical protein